MPHQPAVGAEIAQKSASEIVSARPISEVWAGLGGGPLRHGRGRAFWRDGDGHNVSLSNQKQTFYDFASGAGGGVLDLIQLVRDCSRRDALRWLADYAGVCLVDRPLTAAQRAAMGRQRATDERDLPEARWFGRTAEAEAEEALEQMDPCDWGRATLTEFLRVLRKEASLLAEYRASRKKHPKPTAAMVAAGRESEAQAQRELARVLMGGVSAEAA